MSRVRQLIPSLLYVITFWSFIAPTSAFYQVTLTTNRGQWFNKSQLSKTGTKIKTNKINECQRYHNIRDKGPLVAMGIYNKLGSQMATTVAFWTDGICGDSKTDGQQRPVFLAVLDPNSPGGVWVIDFVKAIGDVPWNIISFKAIDFAPQLLPDGLLHGIGSPDTTRTLYSWPKYSDMETSGNPDAITGSIYKVLGEKNELDGLKDSGNIYMALRDLTERAITQLSPNSESRVWKHLFGTNKPQTLPVETPKEIKTETMFTQPKGKSRQKKKKKDTKPDAEEPEWVDDILAKYIDRPKYDQKTQDGFLHFLDTGEIPDEEEVKVDTLAVDDDVPDDQRLVKAAPMELEDPDLDARARKFQAFMNEANPWIYEMKLPRNRIQASREIPVVELDKKPSRRAKVWENILESEKPALPDSEKENPENEASVLSIENEEPQGIYQGVSIILHALAEKFGQKNKPVIDLTDQAPKPKPEIITLSSPSVSGYQNHLSDPIIEEEPIQDQLSSILDNIGPNQGLPIELLRSLAEQGVRATATDVLQEGLEMLGNANEMNTQEVVPIPGSNINEIPRGSRTVTQNQPLLGPGDRPLSSSWRDRVRQRPVQPAPESTDIVGDIVNELDISSIQNYLEAEDAGAVPAESFQDYERFNAGTRRRLNP
ncbi:hypothetical protein H072_1517 [Dactylellina haptotyla CBS 200.50]|uniref:Uncharacterized protein n=1 Tax=Dactylellina haptotyla (strain CBS 200.50) TaxID=1284197 RepID=S8ANF5_DACHA|nr:hypothetical protein H072_1517 [Dactylellina haptotyla CBS 200.50]